MRFLIRSASVVLAIAALTLSISLACGGGGGGATSPQPPAPPAIGSFTANPGVITVGGSAALSFAFTGGTGSIDQGVGAVNSGTNATVTPAVTTTYLLKVVNSAGASDSKTATVTVAPAPVVPTILAPAQITAGMTGLTASVADQAGMTYAWTVSGGTPTAGATSSTVTFTAGGAGTLTLTCTITNAALASVVGTATVNVVDLPVATGLSVSNATPLHGATVTLTPIFSGGAGMVDNGIGAVTSGTSYPTPALNAAVTYTLTVTNAAGSKATSSVTVTPQTVAVAAISPSSPNVTVLTSLTFVSTVSGALNTALGWTATGGTMDPASGLWTAPSTAGTYTITATSQADATKSASTLVTAVPVPVAVITAPATAAAGQKFITASVPPQPGMVFAWTISGGTITSSAATNQIRFTAEALGTLTLNCTVTNAAHGTASGTAAVTVLNIPWINEFAANPPGVQAGAAMALHFDLVGGMGSLDNAIGPVTSLTDVIIHPTVTTPYTLTVTPTSGPAITQTISAVVGTLPVITTDLASTLTATQSTNATLSVTASGNPAITGYQWYFNGAPISSKTEASLTLYSVTPADAGDYYVVASNLVGSTQSKTLTLTVTPIFTVSGRVSLVGDGTGIPGVTLSLDTSPTPTTTVTDSAGLFSLTGILAGNYTLTASMAVGTNVLFLPASQAVVVTTANVLDRQVQAALGYAVSGTVSYLGLKTDRIYLRLDGGPGGVIPGLSLPTKGAYVIRGVPPGTYTLTAWMDNLKNGNPNASNPVGTRSHVVVGFGDVSGADVTLADVAATNLTGLTPVMNKVAPMDGGAIIRWEAPENTQKVEVAESYLVEWSTSSTFATVKDSITVPAMGQENPMVIISSLDNGTPYYFRFFGKANGTTSAASAVFGPVTPALATGLNSVSGTVTFTGPATGPLVVGLFDQTTQIPYAVRIPKPVIPPEFPVSSQAFTISGVPGSSYFLFGILDQNDNGHIDLGEPTNIDVGDIAKTSSNASSLLEVRGNLANQNLILPSANAIAYIGTSHQSYTGSGGTSENYGLQFDLRGNAKLPVNMTLLVGSALLDLGKPGGGKDFGYWFNFGNLRPTLGDVFTVRVGYSDGTSEDLPVTVTSVLDAFPTILAMTGTPTVPTFHWAAPVPAPNLPYTYRMWVALKTGAAIWQYPSDWDMPATQLSVPFNVDGLATPATLTPGTAYMWSINLRDSSGNSAEKKVEYTP